MRRPMAPVAALLATLPAAAHAHGVTFVFTSPSGLGNHPDGGTAFLAWFDIDTEGLSEAKLWAAPRGLAPFFEPGAPGDLALHDAPLRVQGGPDTLWWDTSDAGPGCYQPYAVISEPGGAGIVSVAPGLISVSAPGDWQPSVWIANPTNDRISDGGTFDVDLRVEDLDDSTTVTLFWRNRTRDAGVIAAGLWFDAGSHRSTLRADFGPLPPGPYEIFAEIEAADGRRCQSFWQGIVFATGATAAPDAGPPGPKRVPFDAGWLPYAEPDSEPGCSCSGGALWACALAALLPAARRRR